MTDDSIVNAVKYGIADDQQGGVTRVPFVIFNDTYGISGAQAPSAIVLDARCWVFDVEF